MENSKNISSSIHWRKSVLGWGMSKKNKKQKRKKGIKPRFAIQWRASFHCYRFWSGMLSLKFLYFFGRPRGPGLTYLRPVWGRPWSFFSFKKNIYTKWPLAKLSLLSGDKDVPQSVISMKNYKSHCCIPRQAAIQIDILTSPSRF